MIISWSEDLLTVRDATDDDNEALVALTAACTMHGDIALRMDRAPDFFTLNRLEGDSSRVGVVADDDGRIVGCVAASRRLAYVNGRTTVVGYASDLKVHPDARGSGAADLLSAYVRDATSLLCGEDAPVICTVLAGNRAMEHRARGPRGTPILSRFATLSVMAIPLLWERSERSARWLRVRSAGETDVEQMAEVWGRVAVGRQFAGTLDPSALREWTQTAPGLDLHDYLLALDPGGHIRGFLGVWDQTSFKQMRVVGYSRRLRWATRGINMLARFSGAPPLPEPGGALPALATVHVCASDPVVLRTLLLEAYRRHRGGRFSFITVGLDVRDPLLSSTRALLGQPTYVNAYVTTPGGPAEPATYTGRPLHLETALV